MGCCGKIAKGVAGLTKAALGIDRAPDEVIALRRNLCRVCNRSEQRKRKDGSMGLTSLSRCRECDCFIAAKTTILSEKCSIGLW